jgi:hypothetical protein
LVVFGWIAQEVDNFGQLALGFFLTGHIGKGHLRPLGIVLPRSAPAETEDVLLTAGHLAPHEEDEPQEKQNRQEAHQQTGPQGAGSLLSVDHHVLRRKLIHQLLIVRLHNGRNGGLELTGFGIARSAGGFDRLVGVVPEDRILQVDADRRIGDRRFLHIPGVDLRRHHRVGHRGGGRIGVRHEVLIEIPADQGQNKHADEPARNARTRASRLTLLAFFAVAAVAVPDPI